MKWENRFNRGIRLILSLVLLLVLSSCNNASVTPTTVEPANPTTNEIPYETQENDMVKIQITIKNEIFSATLYDNEATQALIRQLPLTITMEDLNGNEKFHYLADALPTDSYNPSEIKSGDLLLYGSDCLVLFYESFSTSYSYTRLGYIENVSGLSGALGRGNVQVRFTLK